MRTLCVALAMLVWLGASWETVARQSASVGNTQFAPYEGAQKWPTGQRGYVIQDYAVPVYVGLPAKAYKVLGRIVIDAKGLEVVGRAFDEAFGAEKAPMRRCANQARAQGGDAVLVTGNEAVLEAYGITDKELRKSAPIPGYRHEIVLVIKFD